MYFSLTISFFLRRNAEISGNFPGNLLVSERNSFRKLYSWAREILTYPNMESNTAIRWESETGGKDTLLAVIAQSGARRIRLASGVPPSSNSLALAGRSGGEAGNLLITATRAPAYPVVHREFHDSGGVHPAPWRGDKPGHGVHYMHIGHIEELRLLEWVLVHAPGRQR